MIRKANWFKVEFYDKNTDTERYRTIKVLVNKRGNIRDFLRHKLETMGFRNITILQWYITASNYLR